MRIYIRVPSFISASPTFAKYENGMIERLQYVHLQYPNQVCEYLSITVPSEAINYWLLVSSDMACAHGGQRSICKVPKINAQYKIFESSFNLGNELYLWG